MKEKFKHAYMDTARRFAELSPAQRRKVGAIVVKDDRIISIGYNGMPVGWDNECEYKDYMAMDAGGWLGPDEIVQRWPFTEVQTRYTDAGEPWEYTARYKLVTKDEVLHAERNALDKLARKDGGAAGASLFTTAAPCIECAKSIHVAGISEVYYSEEYKSTAGIEFLKKCGINVEKI